MEKTRRKITIRNIPDSLLAAMNMRAIKLGTSRERMLLEVLLREFAEEQKVVEGATYAQ